MKKRFVFVTVMLILLTVFCTTGTVIGMENGKDNVDEKYYRQMEKEYVATVRQLLQDKGYENSGVSLTKVLYEDGTREYTLSVHHKRIANLAEEERAVLEEILKGCAEPENNDSIRISNLLVVFS